MATKIFTGENRFKDLTDWESENPQFIVKGVEPKARMTIVHYERNEDVSKSEIPAAPKGVRRDE